MGFPTSPGPSSTPVTATNSSTSLATAMVNVTGSWADIGLNLTLEAGTHVVEANVLGLAKTATPAAGDEGIAMRLYNATAGASITASERPLALVDEGSFGGYRQGVISQVVVLASSSSIRVQAINVGGSVTLAVAQVQSNSLLGFSRMNAIKIAS